MKINIIRKEPSAVQKFFSKPLNFSQRVEKKKLQIAGMICKQMEAMGLNRTKLAKKMEVNPSRVTAMLDGSQNLTIETIMRASEALDQKFECALVPKEHVVHWQSYDSTQHFTTVSNVLPITEPTAAKFVFESEMAPDDLALTA